METQPIIADLPETYNGYSKVSIERVDVPNRVIHFRFVDDEGIAREELNTAHFEGALYLESIVLDIHQELQAHA
jgi:hypothetical protein